MVDFSIFYLNFDLCEGKSFVHRKHEIIKNMTFSDRICSLLGKELNKQTQKFLVSLKQFEQKENGLTKKQIRGLERIEQHFNMKNEEKEFVFTEKMRSDFAILIEYYRKTPYCHEIVQSWDKNKEKFVPSKSQWNKMTQNKYAKKVLESTFSKPKFKKDDCVEISSKANFVHPSHLGKMAIIYETDSSPVSNPVKGGKKYRILPFGFQHLIEVEERFLKKVQE